MTKSKAARARTKPGNQPKSASAPAVVAIPVNSYVRKARADELGDALATATSLMEPMTVFDFLMHYSEENKLTWHLDPTKMRSLNTQAQARLRQADPGVYVINKANNERVYTTKPSVAGDFAHLLGDYLRPPSADEGKPGKEARWAGKVEPIPQDRTMPNGLANPLIVDLIKWANAAGDTEFAESKEILTIAKMAQGARRLVVSEKLRAYKTMVKQNGSIRDLTMKNTSKDETIRRLTDENQTMAQQLRLLEGIDLMALRRDYAGTQAPHPV